jgi:hypothetical protein
MATVCGLLTRSQLVSSNPPPSFRLGQQTILTYVPWQKQRKREKETKNIRTRYCLSYSGKNKEERAYASRYGMKSSNKILKARHIYIKEKLMHTTMNFEKNHGCIIQVWPVALNPVRNVFLSKYEKSQNIFF